MKVPLEFGALKSGPIILGGRLTAFFSLTLPNRISDLVMQYIGACKAYILILTVYFRWHSIVSTSDSGRMCFSKPEYFNLV